jgi:hypothetical protein
MHNHAHNICRDVRRLPVEEDLKGVKGLGVFLLVFSLFFGGMPAIFLVQSLHDGTFGYEMLFVSLFMVIGLGLFLVALNQFFIRGRLTIDQKEVCYQKNSLFGNTHWIAPLDQYQGLLYRSEYHSGGKNNASYTLYIIELRHEEKGKSIRLHQSKSDNGVRALWEDYCRALKLPALEEGDGGLVRRDAEDLDKSVRQLVAEDKIKIEFDHRKRPPEGLSLEADNDRLTVTVNKKALSPAGAMIMLLFPGVFIYVGFFLEDAPIMFGVVGVIMEFLMIAVVLWILITKPQVRLSKGGLELLRLTPWGAIMPVHIYADDIEQVMIQKLEKSNRKAVVIVTDSNRGTIGEGLDAEGLEWLKSCILTVISAPKEDGARETASLHA